MDPAQLSRLRWRCRLGMRELDVLLERYVVDEYATASADDQATFERLLELPLPTLLSLLLGRENTGDTALDALAQQVREPAQNGAEAGHA